MPRFKRSYTNFDYENYILDVLGIDWEKHTNIELGNVNHSLDGFLNINDALLDRYAPLKKISNRRLKKMKHKPWITKGLLNSIQKKDSMRKKFMRTRDILKKQLLEKHQKKYRNILVHLIRESKTKYYKEFFNTHKQNLRKTWSGINEIINIKKKHVSQPSCLKINGIQSNNPKQIAETFNNYFSTVAQKVDSLIPPTNNVFKDYLKNPNINSFFIQPTDADEVNKLICTLDPKKSNGPNSVPTKLLKLMKDKLSKPLSDIVNLSFSSGIFPTKLEIGNVIPVFKKGDKLSCENYRPISLLSNISKIFEKLMYTRLYSFLSSSNVIYKQQFGFRSKHSTNHALIEITEKIRIALDQGKLACGIFVDLTKAFDTVNHKILLEKLKY